MLFAKQERWNLQNNMKILFFGDICGKTGRQALQKALPELRDKYKADFVIVNGENATHGKGLNRVAYDFFLELGVNCITGGDHIFDITETEQILNDKSSVLIRPANYPDRPEIPGVGWKIIENKVGKLGVINLLGRIFMGEGMDNPFDVVDKLLNLKDLQNIPVFVDFHTEATSEIVAMGHYLDGRVSAVVGTHTHVQTNDARILPNGTAYISDVGMVGGLNGVIGVKKEIILMRFLTGLKVKHEVAESPAQVNGLFLGLGSEATKKIELINQTTN